MSYRPNNAQREAVLRLAAPKRYKHFIDRVADGGEVWLLKGSNGYVSLGDDAGNQGIGFWPHADYAALLISTGSSEQVVSISVHDFANKWLPGMQRDGVKAVVFPTPAQTGMMLEPSRVQADLEQALADIE